jgi:hypothetical protein
VLIGMLPAARVGDMAVCVGPPDSIAMGSPTVIIGGMMAARQGDPTVHGGVITMGFPMVLIGEAGSAGGGGGGGGRTGSGGGAGSSSLSTTSPTSSTGGSQNLVTLFGKSTKAVLQTGALKEAAVSGAPLCET